MANRIQKAFQALHKKREKALIPFLTAGDPTFPASLKQFAALDRGGADAIEIGVPCSDPMADGPVIQKASERALARGATMRKVLALVAAARKKTQKPIILMGYFNPILAYGLEKFARDAARA